MCDCKIPDKLWFNVGDTITFEYFGKEETGEILQIGTHGYWVKPPNNFYGTASIRCPFKLARRVE